MLNRILIFFICISLFATQLHAGPASPDLIEVTQPDGSSFKIRKHGDEFQNWTETETGHTVLKNLKTKEWEYAVKNSDGSLGLSGQKVSPQQKAPTDLPKHLKPQRNTEAEKLLSEHIRNTYQQRLNQTSATPSTGVSTGAGDWVPVPVSGNRNLLIVLVNFADRTMTTTTPASWSAKIFDTAAGAKSVAKYFKDNSFSTLNVLPAAHTQSATPGVVSVTIADNHPNSGKSFDYTSETTVLNHALAQAASYVNFPSFDTNNNGTLEQSELSIYFIYAGYEDSGSDKTPKIWAHAWGGYSVLASGKYVTRWAINGELNNADVQHPMGVIAHELGHALCGLPDLYDTSDTNGGMGHFSLMAGGSWGADIGEYGGVTPTALDAWTREYLGWATPITPTTSGALSLAHPLSSQSAVYKFVSPLISSSEYFLVENRQPTGWDLGLRGYLGSGWLGGLLITHIDITSGTAGSNDINSYTANNVAGGGHQGVVPVQASTASCNMLTTLSRGCSTTFYYSGNNASWGPSTTPNSNYYSSAATNFSLTGISAQAATMTGSFSFTPPVTKTLTVSKSGTGSGTVSSSPAGISCGSTCSANFLQNENVTLTAAGDAGSIFTGWSGGNCSGTGTCTVSLADDTAVTATFVTTTLGEALNIPGITVTTSGNANWFPESSTSHDGSSAAQSGDINDNQTSSMQFTVHGPGTLSFWWKASSESGFDYLKFYIDGVAQGSGISGTVDWTPVSGITIPTGTHTLSWIYSKDGSMSSGSDAGWVDQIFMEQTLDVFIQGAGSGTVLMNPYSINCSTSGGCATNYNLGTLVTLIATPSGSSTFGGWNGCTTPSGTTCNLIMDERKSVTATFNAPHKVKIYNGASYETISDGYEAANSGDVIMLAQDTFASDLILNINKAVTLSGGWYPDFHGTTGLYSDLQGILTVANGSLTVENLIIK
ncbi:M6 family metalloprotease domain-containing protein [Trichlorobacter thiogenes]|uniref:M6 family metalloprotease domain-containing protein n=1 Tax=Trichlorobacter thiogenes TaxID=115783 RepID=A0A1T4PDA4_9BACT|nr:M6 family metalloprotease domain-containing protein [Trichlorobacter thiogenes]SJZ88798.1 M6 family metalloprotease domain-containing protein [Trichlorobacter thiogenes]